MKTKKYTDLNGKEIVVDMGKSIFNITDDLASEGNSVFRGSVENTVAEPIVTEIVDAQGNAFSIADGETSFDDIIDIDVHIEASHSDTKINDGYYTADSMLRDFSSYITPYTKPFLKNHNNYCEPLGRITSADCVDSANLHGTKAISVVAKITDRDAMAKFMDGRYNTVSIGATPSTITCQHCGKQILKDGKFNFCGHWRGETYDNRLCTWKFEDLDYSELSVVNKPADKFAQVYKIVVNRKSDKKAEDGEVENPLAVKDSEENIVDSILGYENEEPKVEVNNEEEVPQVEDENNKVEILNTKVENLNNFISSLQTEIKNSEEEIKNLKETNTILSLDNDLLSKKMDKLADMYISDLVAIINLGKENDLCSAETPFKVLKEEIKNFISNYKSDYETEKNDNNQIESLNSNEEDNTPKTVEPVINPGLNNNNDKYSDNEVSDDEEQENEVIDYSFDCTVDSLIK